MTADTSTAAGPRRRRLEPDERRAQILACARRLFGERNYESVSTTELARESGVARGLINHYFGTKRELYLEVIRQLVFIPDFAVERLAHGTLEQRITASIDRFLEVIERNRKMWLGMIGTGGYGRDPDVAAILAEADADTADRMLETLGLTEISEGREELRAMLRCYNTMAKSVTGEWMLRGTLTREQVRTILCTTLASIVRDVHEPMFGG
ncbi:MAG TPA: helix-turn-helix domain-containing protein [Pseudonocardiaceae bacterium]|jgi:AcrR family transcriptional regulator|nr:helix-turn-helix domain-containing protein [Pseudonocardiaceae bacterium]